MKRLFPVLLSAFVSGVFGAGSVAAQSVPASLEQINQRLGAIESTLLDIQEGLAPSVVTSLTSAPFRMVPGEFVSCDVVNAGDTPVGVRLVIIDMFTGAPAACDPGNLSTTLQPGRGTNVGCAAATAGTAVSAYCRITPFSGAFPAGAAASLRARFCLTDGSFSCKSSTDVR
jgi:hypothetical protein